MANIQESEVTCRYLLEALTKATDSAYATLPPKNHNLDPDYDRSRYGQSITSKGGCIGKATCSGCGKHIEVYYRFPKITATNHETGQPIVMYSSLGGEIHIKVSGHKCSKSEHQKR